MGKYKLTFNKFNVMLSYLPPIPGIVEFHAATQEEAMGQVPDLLRQVESQEIDLDTRYHDIKFISLEEINQQE